jgi:cytochrome c oxidase assembly factor CtaG
MIFWNVGIGILLGTAVLLYGAGWRRLPTTTDPALLPHSWRSVSFAAAILVLFIALFSPVHALADRYFSMHVLQRLLLVAVVPSLFFSGNPLPVLFAGLPVQLQKKLILLPQTMPWFVHQVVRCTGPVPVWFLFVSTFWLWHDVQMNRLLLQADWVHRLENVTLLATAVFYWWHIMAASPRLHPAMPPLWRVAYAALGAAPVKAVGLVLMFTATGVYHYPAEISFYNLEITDQSLGAAIVWAVGGVVFTWTAVLLMRSWLKEESDKPGLPESIWSSEEMMLAPGFGKTPPYAPPKK